MAGRGGAGRGRPGWRGPRRTSAGTPFARVRGRDGDGDGTGRAGLEGSRAAADPALSVPLSPQCWWPAPRGRRWAPAASTRGRRRPAGEVSAGAACPLPAFPHSSLPFLFSLFPSLPHCVLSFFNSLLPSLFLPPPPPLSVLPPSLLPLIPLFSPLSPPPPFPAVTSLSPQVTGAPWG